MVEEEGIIKRVQGQKALVVTRRSEACKSCEAHGACHMLGGDKEVEILADNLVQANEGDRVLISLESRPLLMATFMIYILPIILLMVGAFVGKAMAPRFSLSPDSASVITAVVFFGIALFFVRRKGVELGRRKEFVPQIIKVIEGENHG